jgi:hypothetical protein
MSGGRGRRPRSCGLVVMCSEGWRKGRKWWKLVVGVWLTLWLGWWTSWRLTRGMCWTEGRA